MNKLMLLPLALVGAVHAAPLPEPNIANMVAQNEFVMSGGECAVANRARPPETEKLRVSFKEGKRVLTYDVSAAAAYDIASTGYARSPAGRYLMSERIEAACRKDRDSDGCIYARSRWSQEPLSVHVPGRVAK